MLFPFVELLRDGLGGMPRGWVALMVDWRALAWVFEGTGLLTDKESCEAVSRAGAGLLRC